MHRQTDARSEYMMIRETFQTGVTTNNDQSIRGSFDKEYNF